MKSLNFLAIFGWFAIVGGADLFCGEHEEFHLCGNYCDLTEKTCKIKPLDIENCRPGCVCEEGYYRTRKSKVCQELNEVVATKTKCGINEVYRRCALDSDDWCPGIDHPKESSLTRCECKPGYVRISDTECVAECPVQTTEATTTLATTTKPVEKQKEVVFTVQCSESDVDHLVNESNRTAALSNLAAKKKGSSCVLKEVNVPEKSDPTI